MYNSYQSGYADSNLNLGNNFAGNSTLGNNNVSNNVSNSNVQPQLWMGDLDFNWDETYIKQLWTSLLSPLGIMVHSIKLIRNNNNGQINSNNSGYCFVRFNSYDDATKVLNLYNGKQVPNSNSLKFFKLNWASSNQQQAGGNLNMSNNSNHNTSNNSLINNFNSTPEYSIFVGDLAPTITEPVLLNVFKERYPSVSNVKIMYDPNTGIPRGYGFIRFFNELEQKRSLIEMQGFVINGRSIRVSTAAKPSASNNSNNNQNSMNYNNQNQNQNQNYFGNQMLNSSNSNNNNSNANLNRFVTPPVQSTLPLQFYNDPTNTTIFIGNLNVDKINEYDLYELFSRFGEINYVKIPNSNSNSINNVQNNGNRKVKNCGFIEFKHRKDAETALLEMQSFDIGDGYKLRISWGAKAAQRNLLNQLKLKLQNGDLSQSSTNSTTTPSISTSNSSLFYPTNQETLTNDLLLLQSLNMASANQNSMNLSNNQVLDHTSGNNSTLNNANELGINSSDVNVNNNTNEFASSYIADEARLNDLLLAAKEGNLDNLDLKSSIYNV